MAEKIIISSRNYLDSASTLTADSAVSTLPVTNLQDIQIVKVWRTDGTTSAEINIDLGSEKIMDFFALIAHNLTTSATVRWRLSNDNFSTTLYDSGTLKAWVPIEQFGGSPWGVFSWGGLPLPSVISLYNASTFTLLPSARIARYIRLNISDATNSEGYLQAGRLIVGPAYQPTINYANGVSFEFVDDSRVTKSRGGQVFVDEVRKYRRVTFDLIHLPESEIFSNVFNNIDRVKGVSKDVLVIPQPSDSATWLTQNIYGRLAAIGPVENTTLSRYSRTMTIEEII
tara:strand:+ start:854 stop:1708 length:855 start_codon:yes stop_codon:yes gene_type:complete